MPATHSQQPVLGSQTYFSWKRSSVVLRIVWVYIRYQYVGLRLAAFIFRDSLSVEVGSGRLGHIIAAFWLGVLIAHHFKHVVERHQSACLDLSIEPFLALVFATFLSTASLLPFHLLSS